MHTYMTSVEPEISSLDRVEEEVMMGRSKPRILLA